VFWVDVGCRGEPLLKEPKKAKRGSLGTKDWFTRVRGRGKEKRWKIENTSAGVDRPHATKGSSKLPGCGKRRGNETEREKGNYGR